MIFAGCAPGRLFGGSNALQGSARDAVSCWSDSPAFVVPMDTVEPAAADPAQGVRAPRYPIIL